MSEPTYEVYRPARRPEPEPPLEHAGPPAYDDRPVSYPAPVRRGVPQPFVPGVICTVIWAMTGGGYFWPMWVFLPAVLMLIGAGRGRRGC